MKNHQRSVKQEPGFRDIIREDIRRGDFRRTVFRDFHEMREFFLDDDHKAQLNKMGRAKRTIVTSWWLLKALFLKLTPARRLMLLIVAVLFLIPHNFTLSGDRIYISVETSYFAVFILLFVLMLELKDKLVARDELEEGRAVQTALMPERTPEIPGWSAWLFTRTANEVGGDLVDLQMIDNTTYRISLADVAGKGLKAALLTAKLQATLRALAPDTKLLSEFGAKLNKIFYRDSLRNLFASLVYVEVNSLSGNIRFLNAGHPPPIVVKGSVPEESRKGDPAIGIIPEAIFTEQQQQLKPGETFFIYSDGLTEAKNELGEFYGQQRMMNLLQRIEYLTAKEIGEMIVSNVDKFIGDARPHDDLSMVILKRQ